MSSKNLFVEHRGKISLAIIALGVILLVTGMGMNTQAEMNVDHSKNMKIAGAIFAVPGLVLGAYTLFQSSKDLPENRAF